MKKVTRNLIGGSGGSAHPCESPSPGHMGPIYRKQSNGHQDRLGENKKGEAETRYT
jgi:hypothetical protein